MPLTQVEAWYLKECIKGEALMARKVDSYAEEVTDPQLRSLLTDLRKACERHIDLLSNHVG